MTREDVEIKLECMGFEKDEVMLFEDPSYESAIIGITDDGNVCYSYKGMVESLMGEDEMTMEDAIEFIDYNTIRSLDYFKGQTDKSWPVIVYDEFF